MATTKDGNTCAHIAAAQGSVTVIEELMKFDRQVRTNYSARATLFDNCDTNISRELYLLEIK